MAKTRSSNRSSRSSSPDSKSLSLQPLVHPRLSRRTLLLSPESHPERYHPPEQSALAPTKCRDRPPVSVRTSRNPPSGEVGRTGGSPVKEWDPKDGDQVGAGTWGVGVRGVGSTVGTTGKTSSGTANPRDGHSSPAYRPTSTLLTTVLHSAGRQGPVLPVPS